MQVFGETQSTVLTDVSERFYDTSTKWTAALKTTAVIMFKLRK